ncbi:hypothetical protein [Candidatus Wolbachia massiliensis]|uniref:Uncharacterized protein n=1 Tax=Candidatus Wolbachia massiliensis TaxID=1845000 RepID=A0A7M3U305_9RICK|nr:hypothetical protein [Candidatus Wolbachia massiliensis]QOD38790.1 hypothetical protein ID128_03055 [Candidatus Wolbachia massiliensis]
MNKNIELYSNGQVSEESGLLETQKSSLGFPKFENPKVKEVTVKVKDKTTGTRLEKKFDLSEKLTENEEEELTGIALGILHFKSFYDNLISNIAKYNTGVCEYIDQTIGTKTSEINSTITSLKEEMEDIKEELEGQVAHAPGFTTGEENGLL